MVSDEDIDIDINIDININDIDQYEQSRQHKKRYKKIKKILLKKFGYSYFRNDQYKIINNILNNKDVTAVLPTGYGKSLCFQLPSLYRKKPVIVISPLISLMKDQKELMDNIDVKTCCYNSQISNKNKIELEKEIKIIEYFDSNRNSSIE